MAQEENGNNKKGAFGGRDAVRRAESVRREIAPQLKKYSARTGRKTFFDSSGGEEER